MNLLRQYSRNSGIQFFTILTICILIRILFWYSHPGIGAFSDSTSYYMAGIRMVATGELVDDARPPLYPLFLSGISYLTTGQQAPIGSPLYLSAMKAVVLFQSVAGIVSLFLLWSIMNTLPLSTWWKQSLLLFIGTNIMVFGSEHLILTEALTTTWLLAVTRITIALAQRSTTTHWLVFGIMLCLGVFLKPVYVAIPFLILPILLFLRHTQRDLLATAIAGTVFLLLISYYRYKNMELYGYSGISRTGDINLLGKIMAFNLPIREGKVVPYFYDTLTDYRQRQGPPMPFRFLETYDTGIYSTHEYQLNNLPRFNQEVILASLPQFLWYSTLQLPEAMMEPHNMVLIPPPPNTSVGMLWRFLYEFDHQAQYLMVVFLGIYPALGIATFKKRSSSLIVLFLIGTIAWYQVFFSVFFSFDEFGRLISPATPLLYLTNVAGLLLLSPKKFPVKYTPKNSR